MAGRIGWVKLWDIALDLGAKTGKGLQMLSRIMSHHGRGSGPCQLCDTAPLQSSVLDHILDLHGEELSLEPGLDWSKLLHLLEGMFYLILET